MSEAFTNALQQTQQPNNLYAPATSPFFPGQTTQVQPVVGSMARQFQQPSPPWLGTMGLLQRGNLNPYERQIMHNIPGPEGSGQGGISTLRTTILGTDKGFLLLPSVTPDGRLLNSTQEIMDQYRRTGQHLGIFDSPQNADAYDRMLHQNLRPPALGRMP
jgi:hypothetical protein